MGSKVISFRVPDELYEEFEQKCKDEEVSPTVKLRELVVSVCHQTKLGTSGDSDKPSEARVKVINVEGDKVGKITATNSKKKSWFPLDFSPLFGKD